MADMDNNKKPTDSKPEASSGGEPSFGLWLRQKREAERISLEEIAAVTKIHISQLKHLEADEFSKLPATAFVRGFLVNYARHISCDESEVLKRFQEALTQSGHKATLIVPAGNKAAQSSSRPKVRVVHAPDFKHAPASAKFNPVPKFYTKGRFWIATAIILALVITLASLNRLGREATLEEGAEAIAELSNESLSTSATADEVEVSEDSSTPELSEEAPAQAAVKEKQAAKSTTQTAAATPPAPRPAPAPEVTPAPAPAPVTATPTPPPAAAATPPPPAPAPAAKKGRHNLEIRGVERSWVNVRVDDSDSRGMMIDSGGTQRFNPDSRVVLSLSNAGAVEINWNGTWYEAPGFRGDVRSLTLPDQLGSLTRKE